MFRHRSNSDSAFQGSLTSNGDSNFLLLALSTGNYDIIKLLVENGVDVSARDGAGETVLFKAVDAGNQPVVELLLKHGADPNIANSDGVSVLLRAVSNRDDATLKTLLEASADVDYSCKGQQPALFTACAINDRAVTTELLRHGANVNAMNRSQETVLFLAAREQQVELINDLLAHGADVNHQNVHRETVLYIAVRKGDLGFVKMLLLHGANVNHIDISYVTPIDIAVQNRSPPIVTELLLHGAHLHHGRGGGKAVHSLGWRPRTCRNKNGFVKGALWWAVDNFKHWSFESCRVNGKLQFTGQYETCHDIIELIIAQSDSFEYGRVLKYFPQARFYDTSLRNVAVFSWGHQHKSCLLPCMIEEVRFSPEHLHVCRMLLQHGVTETFSDIFEVIHGLRLTPADESDFHTPGFTRLMILAGVEFMGGSRSLQRLHRRYMMEYGFFTRAHGNGEALNLSKYRLYLNMVDELTLKTVTSLQYCCVMVVRKSLGRVRIWSKIDTLPLPKSLKACVKLTMVN